MSRKKRQKQEEELFIKWEGNPIIYWSEGCQKEASIPIRVTSRPLKGAEKAPSDILFKTHQYTFAVSPDANFFEYYSGVVNDKWYMETELYREGSRIGPGDGYQVIFTTEDRRTFKSVVQLDTSRNQILKGKGFYFRIRMYRYDEEKNAYTHVATRTSSSFEILSKPRVFFERSERQRKLMKKNNISNNENNNNNNNNINIKPPPLPPSFQSSSNNTKRKTRSMMKKKKARKFEDEDYQPLLSEGHISSPPINSQDNLPRSFSFPVYNNQQQKQLQQQQQEEEEQIKRSKKLPLKKRKRKKQNSSQQSFIYSQSSSQSSSSTTSSQQSISPPSSQELFPTTSKQPSPPMMNYLLPKKRPLTHQFLNHNHNLSQQPKQPKQPKQQNNNNQEFGSILPLPYYHPDEDEEEEEEEEKEEKKKKSENNNNAVGMIEQLKCNESFLNMNQNQQPRIGGSFDLSRGGQIISHHSLQPVHKKRKITNNNGIELIRKPSLEQQDEITYRSNIFFEDMLQRRHISQQSKILKTKTTSSTTTTTITPLSSQQLQQKQEEQHDEDEDDDIKKEENINKLIQSSSSCSSSSNSNDNNKEESPIFSPTLSQELGESVFEECQEKRFNSHDSLISNDDDDNEKQQNNNKMIIPPPPLPFFKKEK